MRIRLDQALRHLEPSDEVPAFPTAEELLRANPVPRTAGPRRRLVWVALPVAAALVVGAGQLLHRTDHTASLASGPATPTLQQPYRFDPKNLEPPLTVDDLDALCQVQPDEELYGIETAAWGGTVDVVAKGTAASEAASPDETQTMPDVLRTCYLGYQTKPDTTAITAADMATRDPSAVAMLCQQHSGFDFSGWAVQGMASSNEKLETVLRRDDTTALCSLRTGDGLAMITLEPAEVTSSARSCDQMPPAEVWPTSTTDDGTGWTVELISMPELRSVSVSVTGATTLRAKVGAPLHTSVTIPIVAGRFLLSQDIPLSRKVTVKKLPDTLPATLELLDDKGTVLLSCPAHRG